MITVQRMRRLEIWSGLACAGGARLAVLREPTGCVATVTLEGDDRLTVVLPLTASGVAELAEERVLRIDQDDTTWDEWRIVDVQQDAEQGTITVGAVPVDQELGARALLEQTDGLHAVRHNIDAVGLTPDQIIDGFVLPALSAAGLSWVGKGTITPTTPLDVAVAWETPLQLLRRLAAETQHELQIRRNGSAGYLIDLIAQQGSLAPVADVRRGKNARGLKQTRSALPQATRVYPRGTEEDGVHATMARAVWKVTAVAGNDVTLADPVGGAGPIMFDGQLAGGGGTHQACLRKPDGSLTSVTASDATLQQVTLADASGLAVGDLVQFRKNTAGDDLTFLDSPLDWPLYGRRVGVLDRPEIPSTHNLLANPAMRDWPGAGDAPPPGWRVSPSVVTVERTTGGPFTRTAQQSMRVITAADGEGVESDDVPLPVDASHPYVSGYAGIWVVAGQVRVELVLTTPTGTVLLPVAPNVASSPGTGVWLDLGVSGEDALARGATEVALRIVQHGSVPAEFYVDAGQVTISHDQLPFVEGSGGTRLWQAANERLRTGGGPSVAYETTLADLARLSVATWGDDAALVLGGTVRVTDPRIAVAITTRIVRIERDYLEPGSTKVLLSSRPDDISGTLARPKPPSRTGTGVVVVGNGRPIVPVIQYQIAADGKVTLTFVAQDDQTASFRYAVSTIAQPADSVARAATPIAAAQRIAQVVDALQLLPGGSFYVTAFAYTAAGGESDRAVVTDSWEDTPLPTPTIDVLATYTDRIEFKPTYDDATQYIEVWAQELTAAPVQPVSCEYTGYRVAGQPLDRGDGRAMLAIPVAKAGHWLLTTWIPYDRRNRRGRPIVKITQAATIPTPPANLPDPPVAVSNVAVTNGSCTNELTMPADVTYFLKIRTYRDGVVFGTDITRTAAAGATQQVTHSGLADGVTHVWEYKGVNGLGQESTSFSPSVTVGQPNSTPGSPTPTPAQVPTPIHTCTPYDPHTQAFDVDITPAPNTPSGVTWVVEHRINGGSWSSIGSTSGLRLTHTHPQKAVSETCETRVWGYVFSPAWLPSDYSTPVATMIPSIRIP